MGYLGERRINEQANHILQEPKQPGTQQGQRLRRRRFGTWLDLPMDLPLSTDFVAPLNADVSATHAPPDAKCHYLCGNSLGLMSNRSRHLVSEELNVWASRSVCISSTPVHLSPHRPCRAVIGHFNHPHNKPWTTYSDVVTPLLAEIVGQSISLGRTISPLNRTKERKSRR